MGELKKNNDIVQGIREKIARIEMDNWPVWPNSVSIWSLVVSSYIFLINYLSYVLSSFEFIIFKGLE